MYLQFRGENIAHDEHVVLLVIHRQSVHGIEMQEATCHLEFQRCTATKRTEMHQRSHAPVHLLDGTPENIVHLLDVLFRNALENESTIVGLVQRQAGLGRSFKGIGGSVNESYEHRVSIEPSADEALTRKQPS